jgi:ABC-type uncharacterized transport system auxiliary subunit
MRKVAITLALAVVLAGCGNTKHGLKTWVRDDKPTKPSAEAQAAQAVRQFASELIFKLLGGY